MAFNVWTRSDAVVFNITGFAVLFMDAIIKKQWKALFIYSIISFPLFFAWNLFIKYNIIIDQNVFIDKLFWDADKCSKILVWVKNLITNTSLYGIAFYALFIIIIINIKYLIKDKSSLLLILFFVSWILYTLVFYQMDNSKMDPLNNMMRAPYRRGLFVFIPIIWYYISSSKVINSLFEKYENFLFSGRDKS